MSSAYQDALWVRNYMQPGRRYAAATIAAGNTEWSGTSVEVTRRVYAGLELLRVWGVVDLGWSPSDRELLWWLR